MSGRQDRDYDVQHYEKYYHYTDKKGAQGISSTGKIKASTDTMTDAAFGKGVYWTKLPPQEFSKSDIAKNNYDGSPENWGQKLRSGKTSHYVEAYLPKSQVMDVSTGDRDIHLTKGTCDLQRTAPIGPIIGKNKSTSWEPRGKPSALPDTIRTHNGYAYY